MHKISTYREGGQVVGVILPGCNTILNDQGVAEKIERTVTHRDHLVTQVVHRSTHGGKKFRAHQIEVKRQIDFTAKRIELLESAKKMIEVKSTAQEVKRKALPLQVGVTVMKVSPSSLIKDYNNSIFVVKPQHRIVKDKHGLVVYTAMTVPMLQKVVGEAFSDIKILNLRWGEYKRLDGVVVYLTDSWRQEYGLDILSNGAIRAKGVTEGEINVLISLAKEAGLLRGELNCSKPRERQKVLKITTGVYGPSLTIVNK